VVKIVAGLVVATLAFVVSVPAARAADPKWSEPTEPFTIVGPIHFVGTRGLAVYLLTTPAGHILLNGAVPGTEPLIEGSIRKLGYKVEDIRIILISHAHFDHVGTIAHFKKLTGATLEVMQADVDLLKSGGTIDYVFANEPSLHFEPAAADRVLKDGDTVSVGNVRLTARLTPGHTRGCTTWTTTVRDGGRSYSVTFADGTGVNPGTRFGKDPSYPGIAGDYRRAFRVLESLHPDIFLTYHTEAFDMEGKRARAATEGVAAWVDPDGYARWVAAQESRFEDLVTQETPGRAASAP
jgi:metallo-beta-lactamase class B